MRVGVIGDGDGLGGGGCYCWSRIPLTLAILRLDLLSCPAWTPHWCIHWQCEKMDSFCRARRNCIQCLVFHIQPSLSNCWSNIHYTSPSIQLSMTTRPYSGRHKCIHRDVGAAKSWILAPCCRWGALGAADAPQRFRQGKVCELSARQLQAAGNIRRGRRRPCAQSYE